MCTSGDPCLLLFRTTESAAFSTHWRVGEIRAKLDWRKLRKKIIFRAKKGAEYSTQVSSPLERQKKEEEGGGVASFLMSSDVDGRRGGRDRSPEWGRKKFPFLEWRVERCPHKKSSSQQNHCQFLVYQALCFLF